MASDVRRVIAACFRGLPESSLLGPALAGLAVVERIADRGRVVRGATVGQPVAVILPSADAQGITTAALAEQCLAEAPSVHVIILASRKAGVGRAIGRSLRSGAVVASIRTARELRTVVQRVIGVSTAT